ncbi:MAG: DoxX family protein [Phycisphaerales bacterium]
MSGSNTFLGVDRTDLGLLGLRLVVGFTGFYHGAGKLFGIFGGPGIEGFTGFLRSLSVPMPGVSAWLAALAEFVGGIMVALGVYPRLAALPFAFTMFVACFTAHAGHWSGEKGMEFPFTLGVVLVAIALIGPGRHTIHAWVPGLGGKQS